MWGSGIIQCVVYLALLVVAFSIITPSASALTDPSLKFDQLKIVTEHKDVITLFDTTNPTTTVTITSKDAQGTTIDTEVVNLLPVGTGTGLYRQMVKFTTYTTTNPSEIRVVDGGSVTVTGEASLTDSAQITTGTGAQQWGVRRYDNNYSTCAGSSDTPDVDGVCTNWETSTPPLLINYPAGGTTYSVDCNSFLDTIPCADPGVRDIYVEVDYMIGHRPNEEALRDVIAALGLAPPKGSVPAGIRLHIQLDDNDSNSIFHNACTKFPGLPSQPGFDQLKAKFFGTETERNQPGWDTLGWKQKKQLFHYVLFVHSQCGSTGSGTGEVLGNDAMITLGPFDGQIGSPDQQAGTFMHELGHNINLHHGGAWNDSKNCKPNYMSVMSYSRQFSDLVNDRDLDYSRQVLGTDAAGGGDMLRESQIKESDGIEDYTLPSERITWGPIPPLNPPRTDEGCVNWDLDGNTCENTSSSLNINTITGVGCTANVIEDLPGYEDWQNINLNSKGNGNWADGRSAEAGTEVAFWEGPNIDSQNMVPSTFCPPPDQILSVVPNGSTVEENQTHLDNYRNCAGGAGESDKAKICDAYVDDILTYINSTSKDHFKDPAKILDLKNSLIEIKSICLAGEFNKVVKQLTLLLPTFDLEIINETSLKPLQIVGKKLLKIDKIGTISSSSNELTMEDVKAMRLSRINSIEKFLNNLDDNDFSGGKSAFMDKINPKLESVRESINNDTMVLAVDILKNSTDDGTFDEIIHNQVKQELKDGIKDIYTSYEYSYAVPEFGPIATLILMALILFVVILATKTNNSLIRNISNKN